MTTCAIRSHGDLKHRDTSRDLSDLPDGMRAAYEDAVTRQCGCAELAVRLTRYAKNEDREDGTEE